MMKMVERRRVILMRVQRVLQGLKLILVGRRVYLSLGVFWDWLVGVCISELVCIGVYPNREVVRYMRDLNIYISAVSVQFEVSSVCLNVVSDLPSSSRGSSRNGGS